MIRPYRKSDEAALHTLWNTAGTAMGYAPLEFPSFRQMLTEHPDFTPEHTFVLELNGRAAGLVNGCSGTHIPRGNELGYVTCLILDSAADNAENTRLLLARLEDSFREKGLRFSAVTFFNPIRLPWIVPGTPGHQHNNCPGVAADLPLHGRMLALGYREAARELAMYRPLGDFTCPPAIEAQAARMAEAGYTVALYDPRHHRGLTEMVDSLQNPMWSAEIPEAGRSGKCLLVGLCGNQVAGFTGPVYPEPTGRGYFAGIGVAPQFEKHGLGTLLFYRLIQQEQCAGARYMSLFTGSDNPAQKIYLGAGFSVRREFGVMLKELEVQQS